MSDPKDSDDFTSGPFGAPGGPPGRWRIYRAAKGTRKPLGEDIYKGPGLSEAKRRAKEKAQEDPTHDYLVCDLDKPEWSTADA